MSSNSIRWSSIVKNNEFGSSYIVIDNKNNLKVKEDKKTFKSLAKELFEDSRVNELEKCVILLQMFTFVGNDLYDENIKHYPGNCERSKSENFFNRECKFYRVLVLVESFNFNTSTSLILIRFATLLISLSSSTSNIPSA